jgi:hypothetical protein
MTSLVPRLLVKNYLDDWHLVNSVFKRDLLTNNDEFISRMNVCRPNAGWKNVFWPKYLERIELQGANAIKPLPHSLLLL